MLALALLIACASDSPSATVRIETPTHVEHGTVIAPCPLITNGNYERLMKLMGRDVEARVTEIPPILSAGVK